MLRIIHNYKHLNFSELMDVYREGNQMNGSEQYYYESDEVKLRKAEEDFYTYLTDVFFRQSDSFYCIWEESGHYKSALRLEPYQDGYLLCALETLPSARGHGYASALIKHMQLYLAQRSDGVLYSHVSKRNLPSLAVHRKCGFTRIKDYAVYADGSVLQSHYTLKFIYKKSEI